MWSPWTTREPSLHVAQVCPSFLSKGEDPPALPETAHGPALGWGPQPA